MNSLIDEYKEKFLKNSNIFIAEYEYSEKSRFHIYRKYGGDIISAPRMNTEEFLNIKLNAVKTDCNPIDFKDKRFVLMSFDMSAETYYSVIIMYEWNLDYLIRN